MDPNVSVCCGCCRKNHWLILFCVPTSLFSLNYSSICHYVCVRSCWSSSPHFCGTYSYRSMAFETLRAFASHLAEPVTDDSDKPVCFALYAVTLLRNILEYCKCLSWHQVMNRNVGRIGMHLCVWLYKQLLYRIWHWWQSVPKNVKLFQLSQSFTQSIS
jgi:hypothetical protein